MHLFSLFLYRCNQSQSMTLYQELELILPKNRNLLYMGGGKARRNPAAPPEGGVALMAILLCF